MFAQISQMKRLTNTDVSILHEAVRVGNDLHMLADLQEIWIEDRDNSFVYQYVDGIVMALDRLYEDAMADPDRSTVYYLDNGYKVTMDALAELTKPLEVAYPDAVQELLDRYPVKYLASLEKEKEMGLHSQMENALELYTIYKDKIGKTRQNNLSGIVSDQLVRVLKNFNQENKMDSSSWYDYDRSIDYLNPFLGMPEIPKEKKNLLASQWYQSFSEYVRLLDISTFEGDFYKSVGWLIENESFQQLGKAYPKEHNQLANANNRRI